MTLSDRIDDESMLPVVLDLLERTEQWRPPVDVVRVANSLKLQVWHNRRAKVRGRTVWQDGGRHVLVDADDRPERQCWTIAREIGSHLVPALALRAGIGIGELTGRQVGRLANRFATLLLAPPPWLRRFGAGSGYDLHELKKAFANVSYEVLAMETLRLVPDSVVTVVDNGDITRRQSNLDAGSPPMTGLEWHVQRSAHSSGRTKRLESGGLRIEAWAIHEAHWKREIVRTTTVRSALGVGTSLN